MYQVIATTLDLVILSYAKDLPFSPDAPGYPSTSVGVKPRKTAAEALTQRAKEERKGRSGVMGLVQEFA